jgi:protein-disulfide isomerase
MDEQKMQEEVKYTSDSTSIFNAPPRTMFALGIMVGIAAVSFVGFILSFSAYRNAVAGNTGTKTANKNSNTNTAVAVTNTNTATGPIEVKVEKTDHIRGNKNAKVTLVEFSDFQCPYSEQFNPAVDKILTDYKDKVRLVFKNYPLTTIHPMAQKAAEAAECASDQNKYWEMHDKLFANQSSLSVENFKIWAKDLGLNEKKFNTCLDDGTKAAKVQADQTYGDSIGVNGTPTSYVNGNIVAGAQSYDYVKNLVDQALAAK